jgi:hypothetical protein
MNAISKDATTIAPIEPRTPLGLPPGSVRGILSLMIVGMGWLVLLLPDSANVKVPLNLYCLLPLVILFFFSHGKSIADAFDPEPSPLYLPGGTLRVIIAGGTIAVLAYLYLHHPDRLYQRLQPQSNELNQWPTLLAALGGGLLVGYLFKYMPFRNHWTFTSLQAWISMLSIFSMLAEVVIQAFIKPNITDQIDMVIWQWIVTFLASFYFGSRT